MNILKGDYLLHLKQIIEEKCKYQKVMLLFDNTASNIDISNIYDTVKELAIFNKVNIESEKVKINEIMNGYRCIIYLCSLNSFLSLDFDRTEFINIYFVTENAILPYFLDTKNNVENINTDYLIMKNEVVDIEMIFSLFFNKFYNYLKNALYFQTHQFDEIFDIQMLSQTKSLDLIKSVDKDFEFVDIQILRACEIEYKYLPIVDYLLISAFSLLVKSIKNQTLSMVDIYKSVKENYALVDKFYAMANNEMFSNVINLNFNCINTLCDKCRNAILDRLSICDEFSEENINDILKKMKDYFKNTTGILSYLYLYDIFGV